MNLLPWAVVPSALPLPAVFPSVRGRVEAGRTGASSRGHPWLPDSVSHPPASLSPRCLLRRAIPEWPLSQAGQNQERRTGWREPGWPLGMLGGQAG